MLAKVFLQKILAFYYSPDALRDDGDVFYMRDYDLSSNLGNLYGFLYVERFRNQTPSHRYVQRVFFVHSLAPPARAGVASFAVLILCLTFISESNVQQHLNS